MRSKPSAVRAVPARCSVLVLAAGQGTRMNSDRAKVLHEVAGEPMIAHVLRAALAIRPERVIVVIGHQAETVRAAIERFMAERPAGDDIESPSGIRIAYQAEQRGTGHAVMSARSELESLPGDLLLLYGDVPCIEPEVLRELLRRHRNGRAAMTILTTIVEQPAGYGRIVRNRARHFVRIVEERDCSPAQRRIREINSGIYAFRLADLVSALDGLNPQNAQGEFYLTDAAELLLRKRKRVETFRTSDASGLLGINTRQELAQAGATLRARILDRLMSGGVTITDPESTYISAQVEIGQDTVIHPQVILEGPTRIGGSCVIESWSTISRSWIGERVRIRNGSVITDCRLNDDATVGPFAHLRMGAELGRGATVGNFVEVKKSRLGEKTKSMHLSYLGDATIGDRVNVGAGTVTCNYDGRQKHPTVIEDDVRIGSDTMLVAPVTVGRGAITGAGSVVTKDVAAGTLVAGVPAVFKKKVQ